MTTQANPADTGAKWTPGWKARGTSIMGNIDGEEVQIALMARTTWCGKLSPREAELSAKLRAFEPADTALIAEAGTVANECGRTPRQLLQERDELAEALGRLIACADSRAKSMAVAALWKVKGGC